MTGERENFYEGLGRKLRKVWRAASGQAGVMDGDPSRTCARTRPCEISCGTAERRSRKYIGFVLLCPRQKPRQSRSIKHLCPNNAQPRGGDDERGKV